MTDTTSGMDSSELTLRAVGPATEGGRLPLSELARLAGGIQTSLERLALSIRGRSGRPRSVLDAVRLDFTGFAAGSAVLQLSRPPSLPIGPDLFDESLDALTAGLHSLRNDPATLPAHFTPQVLNGLRPLVGGIGSNNITRIELIQRDRVRATIDAATQAAIRRAQFDPTREEATIVGRLHMGDFSPATLRCRIDTYAGNVLCDFDADLRGSVLDGMDHMVQAEGLAELEPDGSTIHLLHLNRVTTLPSSEARSLDELAAEQGVEPLRSLEDLRAEPIEDFDIFLAALRSARSGDE